MKRTILLAALLLIAWGASAQNESLYQTFDKVSSLVVEGKSHVALHKSDSNYLEAHGPVEKGCVTKEGETLTINDPAGNTHYDLYLQADDLLSYTIEGTYAVCEAAEPLWANTSTSMNMTTANGETTKETVYANADKQTNTASRTYSLTVPEEVSTSITDILREVKAALRDTSTSLSSMTDQMTTYSNDMKASIDTIGDLLGVKGKKAKKPCSGKRSNLDFLWGFNNWGSTPFSGLMGLEGGDALYTSFSSYQLAWNYALVKNCHFDLKIGAGYESDVYKFTNNYVMLNHTTLNPAYPLTGYFAGVNLADPWIDAAALTGVADPGSLSQWSSRLVTCYVTMPVSMGFKVGNLRKFRIDVGVVPGLALNGTHSGLKHEMERPGRNYSDVTNARSLGMNPYKMDVRVDFGWNNGVKLFAQFATLPLFEDTEIYPIKIGFML